MASSASTLTSPHLNGRPTSINAPDLYLDVLQWSSPVDAAVPDNCDVTRYCQLTLDFHRAMGEFCVHKIPQQLEFALYPIIMADPAIVKFRPTLAEHFLMDEEPSAAGVSFAS